MSQPIFNEFVVHADKSFAEIEKKLVAQNIFPGVALESDFPGMKNAFLVCTTETKSKADLDAFVDALSKC